MSAHRTLNDLFRAFDTVGPGRLNDPGDAGTITFTMWGQICSLTSGASGETRTLAQATKPGVLAAIALDTDGGGDVTLTVTGGYNNAADTDVVLANAGEVVQFYSIPVGTSCYWRRLGHEVDQLTPGAGFTGGTGGIFVSSIEHIGSIYKTTIFMDLTGLASSTTDLDIIGKGASPAHFGQITAANNGTLFYGQITCLETPAGGVTDIDFYSATEGTGVFDGGIGALVEVAMRTNGGAWSAAAATPIALTAVPAANKYMYATCGAAGTPATYTAGQFLIELWGK